MPSLPGLKQRLRLQEGASGQTRHPIPPWEWRNAKSDCFEQRDRSCHRQPIEATSIMLQGTQMGHRCPLKTESSLPRQQRLNLLGIDRGETVTAREIMNRKLNPETVSSAPALWACTCASREYPALEAMRADSSLTRS